MDIKVQFPDPASQKTWQEWAASMVAVLTQMISPTPQDQYPIVVLKDVKPSGTGGGTSAVGFNTRMLTTEYDPVQINILHASGSFSLARGRYLLRASVPGYGVGRHQASLVNITDGGVALTGTSEVAPAGVQTRSWIVGVLEPKQTTEYGLQQYCQLAVANGLGFPASSSGELYSQVELWGLR